MKADALQSSHESTVSSRFLPYLEGSRVTHCKRAGVWVPHSLSAKNFLTLSKEKWKGVSKPEGA